MIEEETRWMPGDRDGDRVDVGLQKRGGADAR